MPLELKLTAALKRARWKVKIQEKETREHPHVSILRGTDKWRINLRTRQFMDAQPKSSAVPAELVVLIEQNWEMICRMWDAKYPANPVASIEEFGNGDQDGVAQS